MRKSKVGRRPSGRQGSTPTRASHDGLFARALEHHRAGDSAAAEAAYRQLLAIDSSLAMAWSNLAAILADRNANAEAIAAAARALAIEPGHLNAQLNLVKAYDQEGAGEKVVSTLRQICQRHPLRHDLRLALARALGKVGLVEEACRKFDELAFVSPSDPEPMFAKADLLRASGDTDAAIACYAEVLRVQPDHAFAMSNRGILLAMHSLGNDLDVAVDLCLRAATLRSTDAAIVNNLGIVLQLRGDFENALLVFRQLISDHPAFAAAYSNIGSILVQRMLFDEAEDAFAQALVLDASLREPRVELAKLRRYLCDWRDPAGDLACVRDVSGVEANFLIVYMAMVSSPADLLAYARVSMAGLNASARRIGSRREERRSGRLRIGYLSADFKEHPVGRLLPELIDRHDRERFEIVGYAIGPNDGSSLRSRLARAFDRFVDLHKVSDEAAAAAIHADDIDILVDLTGSTANGRVGILSLRPAPVQVSFLGLPGTSGADCHDYIVADRVLVPPGEERFYTEKVVRLPDCYQPCDTRRPRPARPSRAECGLPTEGFVFCSFNSPMKIAPDVFDVWMRLLHATEGSVLWLYCKSDKARANLLAHAHVRGIEAERIIFTAAVPFEQYLARMACADLFLDTFPYGAGATCNDALWMGLPVITRLGDSYVSRMGGSLLTALGLDELVTRSIDDYKTLASHLANDATALACVRRKIAFNRATSPLFDMERFARNLETAFAAMAARSEEGSQPAGYDVTTAPGQNAKSAPPC